MKGIIHDTETGESKRVDDGKPYPEHPPPTKTYRVYREKITTPRRTIYLQERILEDLTPDEIRTLEGEGLTVEELR